MDHEFVRLCYLIKRKAANTKIMIKVLNKLLKFFEKKAQSYKGLIKSWYIQ